MNDASSTKQDPPTTLAAQQPGPRPTPTKGPWPQWISRLILLSIIGGVALSYWRQSHTQMVYSQIQDRGGQIERKLTEFQILKDSWVLKLTGKQAEEDSNRGVIHLLTLLEPTEEELGVLNRESSIETIYLQAKNLSPGIYKLISRQSHLRRLSLSVPGIGDEQLLRVVKGLHQKAILQHLAIYQKTTVTDAGVNEVAKLHKIDQLLHLEGGSKIAGDRLDFPYRYSTYGSKLNLGLGPCSVTDATLEKLLASTKIQYLSLSSSGVSYDKLLKTKEAGKLHRIDVSNMNLTEEQVLKLSQTHPRPSIYRGKNIYQAGAKLAE